MAYVDGFVIPIQKKKVKRYLQMARQAGKVWREHGALEYREAIGDDLNIKGLPPFGRTVKLKPGETVVFAWIVYKSRAHRDRVNAKVMADPRMSSMCKPGEQPFDMKRLYYGGFTIKVDYA